MEQTGAATLGSQAGRFVRGAAVVALLALAGPARAEAPVNDFTFKRIKAPAPGQKPVLVQIDPAEQARLLAIPAARPEPAAPADPGAVVAAPAPKGPGLFDWYWAEVSPTLGPVSGRFGKALEMLGKAPGGATVPAPRMQTMQDMANRFGTEILKATIGTRVSPALALAVIGIESGGRADVVSSAGAVGLMQLIPATASRFGVTDSKDPVQNLKGGIAYLDWLMKEFDGDPLMVLAAYNAGEGAVKSNGGVPPYAETRAYVPKVLAAWQVAQGLCLTPPELVSDPCVFKVIAAGG
ncbi:lytic transglycosylase domain-containing protein [Gemmobacter nectariphilus]|uniref:lytic transglycosylase domain-containing protein n=1 Tax=Gemmobacter nectariphilus TaxID=220343 RepID=UPI00041B900B|nr:lytic transglycosylase domain-containing protein [Gemmobacter nectariphilus]